MKKTFIATLAFLAACLFAEARVAEGRVRVDEVNLVRRGDSLRVEYTATPIARAAERNHTLIFAPLIQSGSYRYSLPPVMVGGKGAKIARLRGAWISDLTVGRDNIREVAGGQTFTATATIPFQEWMHGAELRFEAEYGGCCSYRVLESAAVDARFPEKPQSAPAPVAVEPRPVPQWQPATLADSLSTAFSFVIPASQYDRAEPFRIYDDERENALVVYFRVARHDIDAHYLDNAHTMQNLIGAIRMIMAARDSRVERVVVAGFASPEGRREFNDRLAYDRGVAVKRYIVARTGLSEGMIEVYNGSIDWRGLRLMVAKSSLPEKRQILAIIDGSGDRPGELQRINGGTTYRYLLHEYFPYLRSGAFIRVYYENQ